ncbi:terpene synthase family protein [Chitinophaga nivalis]|uniref:Terpene synthase n=1 Tax=Chitinophaga nivalis TaxID=2991709 RepID=A0ABT3IIY0_9BACT|nr:hypothetical protein [Chitinophaga nivalis]MCW3466392.1 hypothetical protein [Chitinophaga nivalis]MCW3483917.1 hypothetical protein [Chitinophaga nivalis]
MNTSTTIRLDFPFPYLVSPHIHALETEMNQQLQAVPGLHKKHRQKLAATSAAGFACYLYPHAGYQQLQLISRYTLCMFINDDHYHDYPPDKLLPVHQNFHHALRQESYQAHTATEAALCEMLTAIAAQSRALMPANWLDQLIASIFVYLNGTLAEAPYIEQTAFIHSADYLAVRKKSVGAAPYVTPFIELSLGIVLPEEIWQHPILQQLISLTTDILIYTNDILSYPQEKTQKNEVMNLVLILQQEGKSETAAISEVVQLHHTAVEKFVAIRLALPDFGAYTAMVANCVWALEKVMLGNYHWSFYTGRYLTPDMQHP